MATVIILKVNEVEYKQGETEYNNYITKEDGTPVPNGGRYVDTEDMKITAPNGISKIVIIGKHKREGENTYTKEFNPPTEELDYYGLYDILGFKYPSDFTKMEIQITEPTGGTGSEPEPETPEEPEPPEEKEWLKITDLLKQAKDDEIEITTDPQAFEKQEFATVGGMLQQVTNTYINRGDKLIFKFKEGVNKKFTKLAIEYSWQYKFYEMYDLDDIEVIINTQDIGKDRDYSENDDGVYVLELRSYEIKTEDATPPEPEEPEEPDTPTEPETGNLFNIYNITKQNFIDLMGIDSINESFTPVDNSYIIDFYNLPFNIDSIIHDTPTSIKYGKYDSQVKAKPVLKDKIRIDLGSIEIPLKYNNSYDYNINQVLLYLPLTEPVELDYKYIINSIINISYEIDLNNHKTNLVIKSSLINNDIAYITNIDIIDSLLLINSKKERTDYKTRTTVYNHIKTPYIQIIRNTPYEIDSYYSSITGQEQTLFKNLTGYNELIDIDLNFKCNNLEKQELKTILKNGFRIE